MKKIFIENLGKGKFKFWPEGKPIFIRKKKEKYIIWKGEKIELKKRKL